MKFKIALLVLAAAGIVGFWNSFSGPFVLDDFPLIVENPVLRQSNPLIAFSKPFFPEPAFEAMEGYNRYRPLTIFSFGLDHRFWGNHPAGYRWVNLALHWAAALLVWFLFFRITGQWGLSSCLAVVFLIHPIQAEAVSYISSRGTLLAGLTAFGLLCLHMHLPGSPNLRWRWFAAEGFLFAAGLLSQEAALVGPLLIFGYDLVFRQRSERREWQVFFLVFLIYAAIRWLWFPIQNVQIAAGDWVGRVRWFGLATSQYAQWLLLPLQLTYPIPHRTPMGAWVGFLWCAVLLAAVVFAWRDRTASTAAGRFGVLWGILGFLPISNLLWSSGPPFGVHILYVSLAGWLLAAGILLSKINKRVAAAVFLLMTPFWFHQLREFNRFWGTPRRIYQAHVDAGPYSAAAGYNLFSDLYLNEGKFDQALRVCQAAIALEPQSADLYVNLGVVYEQLNQWDEAEKAYRAAIALGPQEARAYNNLAGLALKRSDPAQTVELARQALQIYPDFYQAYGNLAQGLWEQGEKTEALDAYRRAIQIRPDVARLHELYGDRLLLSESSKEAIAEYNRALKLDPGQTGIHRNLAVAYGMQKEWTQALLHHQKDMELHPQEAAAYANYGMTLAKLGRPAEAVSQWQRALEIDPNYPRLPEYIEHVKEHIQTEGSP